MLSCVWVKGPACIKLRASTAGSMVLLAHVLCFHVLCIIETRLTPTAHPRNVYDREQEQEQGQWGRGPEGL